MFDLGRKQVAGKSDDCFWPSDYKRVGMQSNALGFEEKILFRTAMKTIDHLFLNTIPMPPKIGKFRMGVDFLDAQCILIVF